MFRVGDEVKVNGKKGNVAWVHDFTTYNGVAKGWRTEGRVRFKDGSETTIKDMYSSNNGVEKVK